MLFFIGVGRCKSCRLVPAATAEIKSEAADVVADGKRQGGRLGDDC
jgi:hypothetical protein